jgi:hypothetical protein
MIPEYCYNFENNSFYGDLLPSDNIKNGVLMHVIRCADTMKRLNASTSGEVVDGLKPSYKVKWINYY